MKENRRGFTKKILVAGVGLTLPLNADTIKKSPGSLPESNQRNIKLSLNAFSFDKLLRAGTMTIDDLLDFCAKTGFDGIDLTGYYFPGYPEVPADDYIFHLKQKAFRLGIELGCTGVRNDFTWHDPVKREPEKKLVKDWIIVAQKLGAQGLRIFAGTLSKENYPWEERAKWIAGDIRECAEFGKQHGVMLALQNHNDFLKNSVQVETLLKLVDADWVGLMLDVGSYHTDDPYLDIAANSKYAITWQMKEKVFIRESQVDTDFNKIRDIVSSCGYRGYLPLETLGDGDPYQKVLELFKRVRSVFRN
jgi:sugar phosphate isomerase/epimerase